MFPTILIRTSTTTKDIHVADNKRETINVADSQRVETPFNALDSLPLVRFAQWTAAIINTGYIPTGTFLDIGNIQEILQVNDHEKVHVGLPFRTNEKLMKHVSLEASVGYGFREARREHRADARLRRSFL